MKNIKNKRSEGKDDHENGKQKKFDKKKYRLQKYSNKYKSMYSTYTSNRLIYCFFNIYLFALVNQWEERRKKAVLRGYYKELKRDQQTSSQISSNCASKNTNEMRYICITCQNQFKV